MKKLSKLTSLFLATIMALGVLTIAPFTVGAVGNNTLQTAKNIYANTTYTDNISSTSDIDYYKLTISSSSKVSITFKHDAIDYSSSLWEIQLQNTNDETMISFTSNGNNTNLTSYNVGLPSGTYYVKIADGWGQNSADYSFKVNCSAQSYWETEKNNSFGTADSIALNTYYNGTINNTSDIDYYKLTISSSSKVSITFKHDAIDYSSSLWEIQLQNTNDETMISFTSNGNNTNLTSYNVGLPSGTYYVKIADGWGQNSADYSFKVNCSAQSYWETEKNNSFGTADSIVLNTYYNGTINDTSDVDYYKFTVSSATKVNITFKHNTIDYSSSLWEVYIYSSSNTGNDIISLTSNGYLNTTSSVTEFLNSGTYYVKISDGWGQNSADYSFSVNESNYPTSVKVNRSTLTLGVGESYGIIKTILPSNATQTCTWTSSNSSVASVNSSGKVTAKKAGTANITVKTSNGLTATCKVTVKSAPTSVKVSDTRLTLGKGETYIVSQSTNSGSYAWGFSWSSSNTNVATIAKTTANKAKITAVGTGTATITIKTYNGKTATCKVTVKSAPTSVTMKPTSVTLGKGETYTISEVTNSGSYANASNLKWSSTNTSVATVTKGSGNKATITAKGVGTAYVKITLYNGKTATCKVTVKSAPTSVSLSKTSITLSKGKTYTISEVTNSGSYANAANLKWSSTNTGVATVTKGSGNKATITAKSKGTAYIKITLYNGKTAQCKVTVK